MASVLCKSQIVNIFSFYWPIWSLLQLLNSAVIIQATAVDDMLVNGHECRLSSFSVAYNRMPKTGSFIKKRNLFLTVMEAEKSQATRPNLVKIVLLAGILCRVLQGCRTTWGERAQVSLPLPTKSPVSPP